MNTSALKKFAREARIKLLDLVERKIDFVLTADTVQLRGMSKQLDELRGQIKAHGKGEVVEKVSYTWFNRLMALRFMDANGYNSPMVVTPTPGGHVPEILQEAKAGIISDDLKIERTRINDLLDGKTQVADAQTEAYKILLIGSCNALYNVMPFMFERISDYTELLLPDDLLSEFSIVTDIREGMQDDDCKQEELIGWLYQFYIADKKDEVFDGLKKNVKITPENLPAATQLFTPRWIVRYMVENTLGKLWLTFRPQSKLREHMPYFIEAPEGNAPSPLPEGIKGITDVTFLDPCMGSGHILVYAFELFSKIYEEEGFNKNEIPGLILHHNLYGIDIDERAAQLSAFALTMKARSYYSRFLRKNVQPQVIALENISGESIRQSIKMPVTINGEMIFRHEDLDLWQLTQAANFGSLIQIAKEESSMVSAVNESLWKNEFEKLKIQIQYLSEKYHCVVTNPPYMGGKGMNEHIKIFVNQNFNKSRTDLMACFIERCLYFCSSNGKVALINQHSWMFLSSYEKLRKLLIDRTQFESMLHLGPRTFPEIGGEVVQNTAFVLGNYMPVGRGFFFRLTDFDNSKQKNEKTLEAIQNLKCDWRFTTNQNEFKDLPGGQIGYWISQALANAFVNYETLDTNGTVKQGLATGDNERFLRFWFEVDFSKIEFEFTSLESSVTNEAIWVPYSKGGAFKKWYGNNDYVVYWKGGGNLIRDLKDEQGKEKSRFRGATMYFLPAITWSLTSTSIFGCRYRPAGFVFDINGMSFFPNNTDDMLFYLALLNSKISNEVLKILNPTLAFQVGDIAQIPVNKSKFSDTESNLVSKCIEISKHDWDSRELSWDFQTNQLVRQQKGLIQIAIDTYKSHWEKKVRELQKYESELNRHFIEVYGASDELAPDLSLDEITILQEEAKLEAGNLEITPGPLLTQLMSYFIGCSFGRYSLTKPGLILSNQTDSFDTFLKLAPSPSFLPVEDNVITILDGEWFKNDIGLIFTNFLRTAFEKEQLEENVKYVEYVLGKDIRKYFVKDFYNDHVKFYKKRPIYWMFSSSKGSFKALIYMHRYNPDTVSTILNDYLRVYISKLESEKQTLTQTSISEGITPRERTQATKRISELESILKELREYEIKLFDVATKKIEINLDDGVKVNYLKFKDILAPIKGLEKEE